MKKTEEFKTRKISTRTPFWINIFSGLLIVGIFVAFMQGWSLGGIEGYEYIYVISIVNIIISLVLLYGIFKRKSWVRMSIVFICLVMVILAFINLSLTDPSTYHPSLFVNIPFAAYFFFSKKAKEYFASPKPSFTDEFNNK